MAALTHYIIKRLIPEGTIPLEPANRLKIGQFEGYLSIFSNLILFAVKFSIGISSFSIALLADAFHTLMDVGTSAIVIIGFNLSQKPEDKEHPFGHGRAETIASLVTIPRLSVLIIILSKKYKDLYPEIASKLKSDRLDTK